MFKIKITVFTPTYNRAYILPELYTSLKNQHCMDFEWLIVDDGSSDNTEEVVNSWITSNNNFPIRYYKKENGGKCSAINYGLDLAAGELFLVIDSDDTITSDAVQKVIALESTIQDKTKFCGIAFNLGTESDRTPNKLFNEEYKDASLLERYTEFDGERAFAFYTDVHRKYKYPVFETEKFMTEAVVWNRMANDGYLMRFSNDIICIYEYREDGLTLAGNEIFRKNPHGYGLWLKEKDIFTNKSLRSRIMTYYNFVCELKDLYDEKLIAESIGISVFSVRILKVIHLFLSKIKG